MSLTDRVDANDKISLYEYGILRNPETNKTVFCINTHELNADFGEIDRKVKPRIKISYISLDDVIEALEDVEEGYFSFIGSDRKTELEEISDEYLTIHILSLNMYNGWFDPDYL